MTHISYNTFVRAFSATPAPPPGGLVGSAFASNHTICTNLAIALACVLTGGLGLFVIGFVDRHWSRYPKAEEFLRAMVDLYAELEKPPKPRGCGAEVSVFTQSGEKITLTETWTGVEVSDAAGHVRALPGLSLAGVQQCLAADFLANAELHARLSNRRNFRRHSMQQPGEFRLPHIPVVQRTATEAFELRFESLTGADKGTLQDCPALQSFLPRATVLLRDGHQPLSQDVVKFLTGAVSHLPQDWDEPPPAIPPDVKQILKRVLHVTDLTLAQDLQDQIAALRGAVSGIAGARFLNFV
ncbi:hypothetical protein [Pandoraea sputorum]|uniref:Transmembrane protein n=1 Tax=Pandoraea sputorum TaxID=93222 RepID=A0A5E5BK03_9BURK|nr:hypothetical protein [Pandoraea sputorum]VVE86034.1 hypothetical protein PSP31121_05673 [Pandoraea sputorum]